MPSTFVARASGSGRLNIVSAAQWTMSVTLPRSAARSPGAMPNVGPARRSPVSVLTPGQRCAGADVEMPRVSTTTDASPALAKRRDEIAT